MLATVVVGAGEQEPWVTQKGPGQRNELSFPGGASGKELACQCRRCKRPRFDPWAGKIPCRKKEQPTPVFLLGKSHGQRSLEGYSP